LPNATPSIVENSIESSIEPLPKPKKKKKSKKQKPPKTPKISKEDKKRLKKGQKLDVLAKRIGNRLLKDDNFINYMLDRLDGIEPEIPFYDSEEEDKAKLFKNSLKLNVLNMMKKMGAAK